MNESTELLKQLVRDKLFEGHEPFIEYVAQSLCSMHELQFQEAWHGFFTLINRITASSQTVHYPAAPSCLQTTTHGLQYPHAMMPLLTVCTLSLVTLSISW